jgi:hypothetical protein
MLKKIALGILLLMGFTTALVAQTFQYLGDLTEQQFIQAGRSTLPKADGWYPVGKLPNAVSQAIDYNLHDYSLDVGDTFLAGIHYRGADYIVLLRITDARNSRWQWYATSLLVE